jgi:hypothetical protein
MTGFRGYSIREGGSRDFARDKIDTKHQIA